MYGTFVSAPDGSFVRLRLRLHPIALAFMTVWMSLASFAALGSAVAVITGSSPLALTAWAFPIFGAPPCGIGFRVEANLAIEQLRALWSAEEEVPTAVA